MPNVSQSLSQILSSRKKAFKKMVLVPGDVVVRSGPFTISKLNNSLGKEKAEPETLGQRQNPIISHPMPILANGQQAVPPPPLYHQNYPQPHFGGLYGPKGIVSKPPENQVTPKDKKKNIIFYIKDYKGFKRGNGTDFSNSEKKKYKDVNRMYKNLRSQIVQLIKSKDGSKKKRENCGSFENEIKNVAKVDASFQKILDGAEKFLNGVVHNENNNNSSNIDIQQVASLVEENDPNRKMAQERSPTIYNDTDSDDPEEEFPETQEIVESLKQLPLGDSFISNTVPPLAEFDDPLTHSSLKGWREHKKQGRLWAPRKKSNVFLHRDFAEKVTEVNYDPIEVGDQEFSDSEVTETIDDSVASPEMSKALITCGLHDLKAFEKLIPEDDALNKKIDQRICNALELFRNALLCAGEPGEVTAISQELTAESTEETNDGPSDPQVDEELTCATVIVTTCVAATPSSTKPSTKEHTSTAKAVTRKTSTVQSAIRKTVKPLTESTSKVSRETKKTTTSKSTSKKTTPSKENNRRNVIKIRMSQKRLMNKELFQQKDNLTDYEKVFGKKRSRFQANKKAKKSKSLKVTKYGITH